MTDQHRATPEQWAAVEEWAAERMRADSCILELRDRLEALEAQYETQRQATLAWGKDVDNHGRWIDDHLKRIMALESTQHAHADTSQLSDEERRTASEELSKPGSWQPLRTEIIYGEANAHAQNLVRHLSMDQLNYPETPDSSRSPADSLVERVGDAIAAEATSAGSVNANDRPARAAILELANTVAKLGHRVEALEAQYETMRLATLEWGQDMDNHGRWIDDHLKRIMALEAKHRPGTAPADSLVQRVSKRLIQGLGGTWDDTWRMVIREVAAWLRENDAKCQMGGDAAATADLLDAEANQ